MKKKLLKKPLLQKEKNGKYNIDRVALNKINIVVSFNEPIVSEIVILSNFIPNNCYGILSRRDTKKYRLWQLIEIYNFLYEIYKLHHKKGGK